MKKLLLSLSVLICLAACNSNQEGTAEGTDTTGLTNPIAIDTVKHPGGVVNSNVISTDTAAMNVENAIEKAKEHQQK